MFSPKLTTIKQPFEDLCINTVNYLVGELKKEKIKVKKNFKMTIIKRES